MNTFKTTRDVITYASKYIKGKTVDYGAGTAKYRNIITSQSSEYITFDVRSNTSADIIGDALNPPFSDSTFDTVVTTQVLEHVEKPWVMVDQISRILKTGGICIATAPFMVPYHADPYDFFRYTNIGIESLFKNSGFEIIESGAYGKTFMVFSEMIHFAFFNPYQQNKKNRIQLWLVRKIEKILSFLDKFVKNKIIYANVYLIARKK